MGLNSLRLERELNSDFSLFKINLLTTLILCNSGRKVTVTVKQSESNGLC